MPPPMLDNGIMEGCPGPFKTGSKCTYRCAIGFDPVNPLAPSTSECVGSYRDEVSLAEWIGTPEPCIRERFN